MEDCCAKANDCGEVITEMPTRGEQRIAELPAGMLAH